MKVTPRVYQQQVIDETRGMLAAGKRRIIVGGATGMGKSFTMGFMMLLGKNKGNKSLMLTHRDSIHGQNTDSIESLGLKVYKIKATTKEPPPDDANVYIAMVDTFYKRVNKPEYKSLFDSCKVIYMDEAHRGEYSKYYKLCQDKIVLGFTATPLAAKKDNPLNKFFEDIVYPSSVTVPELQKIGRLLTDRYFTTKEAVKYAKSSYTATQETVYQQKNKTFGNTLKFYERHAKGKKSIMACPSVEQCFIRANEFEAAGYRVGIAVGNTKKHSELIQERYGKSSYTQKDSDEELRRFKANEIDILISVSKITTGLDVIDIQCVIVDRSLSSLVEWLQLVGRGGRPCEGMSEFIILDPHGNVRTMSKITKGLGMWSDNIDWIYKFNNPKLPFPSLGEPEGKVCPKCETYQRKSASVCEKCGHKFSKAKPKQEVAESVELKRIERPKSLQALNTLESINEALKWEIKHNKASINKFNYHVAKIAKGRIQVWRAWEKLRGYREGYGDRMYHIWKKRC